MEKKIRLDDLLVLRHLADSKTQAQALIMAGKVFSGTQRLDKAGKKVDIDLDVRVEAPPRFVSRGGEKLEAALTRLCVGQDGLGLRLTTPAQAAGAAATQSPIQGASCLDIGASTGGFTDCLLQHGAREVVAIDVGHGQLHPKIKNDPRVKSFEGINARDMQPSLLPHAEYDVVVMDLAFISQKKVLENVWRFVRPGGVFISLIKPQFEITKPEADRCQGVVKDETIRDRVVREVRDFALAKLPACTEEFFMTSPIEGMEGNREFLMVWRKNLA